MNLAEQVIKGDRRALAQAITLVESTKDQVEAALLMDAVLPHAGKSIRLGISGIPGVGKSTFIESFGSLLIERGHKVAVVAIDPSSPLTHGSILADKTRMPRLSASSAAFIRPSPSAGTLGGVATATREVITLCEAAGFDMILIETVGVGQSEVAISSLTDMVLLLLPPAGGDDLQGMKKGIVEIADLILVNKADGAFEEACNQAVLHYSSALSLSRSPAQVQKVSALKGTGLEDVRQKVTAFCEAQKQSGQWESRRSHQLASWFEDRLKERLWHTVLDRHGTEIATAKSDLLNGKISFGTFSHEWVNKVLERG